MPNLWCTPNLFAQSECLIKRRIARARCHREVEERAPAPGCGVRVLHFKLGGDPPLGPQGRNPPPVNSPLHGRLQSLLRHGGKLLLHLRPVNPVLGSVPRLLPLGQLNPVTPLQIGKIIPQKIIQPRLHPLQAILPMLDPGKKEKPEIFTDEK